LIPPKESTNGEGGDERNAQSFEKTFDAPHGKKALRVPGNHIVILSCIDDEG